MTDAIEIFLNELEKENISYVHWKSNTNIDKALSGEDDLDIVVDPQKKEHIFKIFKKLHIIRGFSTKDSWQNEIFHYFGIDIQKKKLVHIHLHFLLEVGYDMDKSVNLPIVEKYINDKIKYKYIYIPTVENEYIILIIRLLLKNAFIPYILLSPLTQLKIYKAQKSKGVVTGNAYNEFLDLYSRVDRIKLNKSLEDVYSFLKKDFFYQCEDVIKNNDSLKDYFSCSGKLKKMLKTYRYHEDIKSFFISFYRVNQIRLSKFNRNKIKFKKLPEYGGKIFAFVGGDGAGKTSNIEKLYEILVEHFYVEIIHVGRPKVSILGIFFRITAKLFKNFGLKDIAQSFIYLEVANNRKKAYEKALDIKRKGGIVLLDRIPLEGITAMDCPRVNTLNKQYTLLLKLEEYFYKKIDINKVDKLIVLKLNPEIALRRRPEDDAEELLIRSGQIWEKDFSNIDNSHVINTENTFHYVEEEILKIVWNSINEV